MTEETGVTEAHRKYAEAYDHHYTHHDLRSALRLYVEIIQSHPEAPESGYARAQVQNIVQATVPQQVLLTAHVDLCVQYLDPRPTHSSPNSTESAQGG